MNTAEFEELLKQAIGLDAASIGTSAVNRAVTQRMTALGYSDPGAYAAQVRSSSVELQALIEAIVVPETWFFRDREAFLALGRRAAEWLARREAGVFRALSLPCSTGEEPYSIAMALADAGLPPARFRVEAIDVSADALARARAGVYGRNSFRGADLMFRDRFFRVEAASRWVVNDNVQRQVQFERGNLLDAAMAANREPYDALFCRNLLIYFDRPTQDRAVAMLNRLLAAEGWLFVGPSETGLWLSHGFVPVRVPLAFAFQQPGQRRPARTEGAPAVMRLPPLVPRAIRTRPRPALPAAVMTPPKPRAPVRAKDPLDEIARLADEGHLAEAARLCEEHVRTNGRSAKALYLLGVVRDASGQHAEAAELYRKVLYLEPEHHDALMHLSYLLEGQGDATGAQVLVARARRVAQRQKG